MNTTGSPIFRSSVFAEDSLYIVANREPYAHSFSSEGKVRISKPVSGLVSALDPLLKTRSGCWIAQAQGNADHLFVDNEGELPVPPENPKYRLKRVWLSSEESAGFYRGFSNEALWPLCHSVFQKPLFRRSDWEAYRSVNKKFADAVFESVKEPNPTIFVQDYHFALLPGFLRDRMPQAKIVLFWHIPWSPPETMQVCPWIEEMYEGMLSADVVGFHTHSYVQNFLRGATYFGKGNAVAGSREVVRGPHRTIVWDAPIGIDTAHFSCRSPSQMERERSEIRQQLEFSADRTMILGVDRLDYTKGLLEKFCGIEKLVERDRSLVDKVGLVQIASPTRPSLTAYQDYRKEVENLAARINRRFARSSDAPLIRLITKALPSAEVEKFYSAADICLVTSLQDGLNLVAKEYVASRCDLSGTLILSQFAGVAEELSEANLINPFSADQIAESLSAALSEPLPQKQNRMGKLRRRVFSNDISTWSSRLLGLVEGNTPFYEQSA